MEELKLDSGKPIALAVDNTAARDTAYNPEHHKKVKHIERRHFYVREDVEDHKITVLYVNTLDNLSDFFHEASAIETLLRHAGCHHERAPPRGRRRLRLWGGCSSARRPNPRSHLWGLLRDGSVGHDFMLGRLGAWALGRLDCMLSCCFLRTIDHMTAAFLHRRLPPPPTLGRVPPRRPARHRRRSREPVLHHRRVASVGWYHVDRLAKPCWYRVFVMLRSLGNLKVPVDLSKSSGVWLLVCHGGRF